MQCLNNKKKHDNAKKDRKSIKINFIFVNFPVEWNTVVYGLDLIQVFFVKASQVAIFHFAKSFSRFFLILSQSSNNELSAVDFSLHHKRGRLGLVIGGPSLFCYVQ